MCGNELFIRLTKSQGHFKFRIRRHFSSSLRFLVWEAYAMKTSGVRSLRRRKMCGSIISTWHALQKTKTIKLTTCKMFKMTQKCQYRQRLQEVFVIERKFGKIRDFAVDNNSMSLFRTHSPLPNSAPLNGRQLIATRKAKPYFKKTVSSMLSWIQRIVLSS